MSLPTHLPHGSLILAAHPDDESVGAAVAIARTRDVAVIYATDGAPHDPALRPAAPDLSREAYAAMRREERSVACERLGIRPDRVFDLGAVDQEAPLSLPELTRAFANHLRELEPPLVLVHPYEGGHPDHDACAFIAHAARTLLDRVGAPAFALWETTSYHAASGELATGQFLEGTGGEELARTLTDEERTFKREVLACHQSQLPVLAPFPLDAERFRPAPAYDFSRPPHPSPLLYELFGWPMRAERFVQLVREAALRLEVDLECL